MTVPGRGTTSTRLDIHWPSRAERERGEHAIEWSTGWQYGCTHRLVRNLTQAEADQLLAETKPPAILLEPPSTDDGWTVNVDRARSHKGYMAVVPAFCKDGTVVHQRVYWRRSVPGLLPYDKANRRISSFRGDA